MIFLDTGFIFALVCRRDANHQRVRGVMNEYRGRDLRRLPLTTNHVVEETITLVRSSAHSGRLNARGAAAASRS